MLNVQVGWRTANQGRGPGELLFTDALLGGSRDCVEFGGRSGGKLW